MIKKKKNARKLKKIKRGGKTDQQAHKQTFNITEFGVTANVLEYPALSLRRIAHHQKDSRLPLRTMPDSVDWVVDRKIAKRLER